MSRVVFLESQAGTESLFTRGLRSGARAAGWQVDVAFLSDAQGVLHPVAEVRAELQALRPDTICFLMDAPLHLEHLWADRAFSEVDKISLWFDDYNRSPKTLAHPEVWTHWQQNHGVRVGFWDGYWRDRWRELTGAAAFPACLAADPQLLQPYAAPWNPAWHDRAAFIGTIPSLHSLEETAQYFPAPLRYLIREICAAMETEFWPLRPYELADACLANLGIKYQLAIEAALRPPEVLALWNQLLWRWGKRIARLRGLAAIGRAVPLAILSGHQTECYADEAELRAALPSGIDLVYADTKTVLPRHWKNLFQTGKFQVQVTDPQSVEGGLPFRVFECAACAVPLLSDYREEIAERFPQPCGPTLAVNEAALAESAFRLWQTPPRELQAQAQVFHESFLRHHTWAARWRQLTAPSPLQSPAARTARAELAQAA